MSENSKIKLQPRYSAIVYPQLVAAYRKSSIETGGTSRATLNRNTVQTEFMFTDFHVRALSGDGNTSGCAVLGFECLVN
jgi:hypothetical protein